jgi:hypothetical protein
VHLLVDEHLCGVLGTNVGPIEDSARNQAKLDSCGTKDEMSAECSFKYQTRAGSRILRIEIDEDEILVFELLQILNIRIQYGTTLLLVLV